MPELEPVATDETPSEAQLNQLIWSEQGVAGKGIARTWTRPDSDLVILTADATGVNISKDDGTTPPTPVLVEGSAAGGALTGTYPSPTLAPASVDLLVPPGTIWAFAGPSAPDGWLPCDGVARSTATYPKLYAVIGATYGTAGPGTFRVPNLVGRVVLGESPTHPRGQSAGSETAPGPVHTHPGPHRHGLNNHTHGLNGHTHDVGHDHFPLGTVRPVPTSPVNALATSDTHQTAGTGYKAVGLDHWHNFDVPALPPATQSLAPTAPATATTVPTTVTETADTDTQPAAVYPDPIPTLPPYGVALYIIRTGA